MKKISVIIPVLNEEHCLSRTINTLWENNRGNVDEILLIDGGSNDRTKEIGKSLKCKIIESSVARRSFQMNLGAEKAKNEILYFVHADALPPEGYDELILTHLDKMSQSGCFRSRFDSENKFLLLCSYCTRFKPIFCRGGGQTLFCTKAAFEKSGGYNNEHIVMEEYDFILRLKKITEFNIIPANVGISARTYRRNGTYKLYLSYSLIFILFFLGVKQERLKRIYRSLIR